jgi:hypothetical protein
VIKHSDWSLLVCVLNFVKGGEGDEFHSYVCALMGSLEEFGENFSVVVVS